MKTIFLMTTFLLAVCLSEAQPSDPAFSVSSNGRTDMLDKRYKVRAWVERVRGTGYVLKFASSISFSKAVLMRWTKNEQGNMVNDKQTTTFNPTTKSFLFNLDSPAYKGGLMYDVLLYVNAGDSDNEYVWRIHLVRQ